MHEEPNASVSLIRKFERLIRERAKFNAKLDAEIQETQWLIDHPPDSGPQWQNIKRAAYELGYSEGHLRSICRECESDGRARKIDGKWHIDVTRFTPVLN